MTASLDTVQASETIAAVVVAAASAAASLVPSPVDLVAGEAVTDPDAVVLPPTAAAAVSARLTGEVTGDVVLVLSAEVVEALDNSPVGPMDVADRAAAGAGGRRLGARPGAGGLRAHRGPGHRPRRPARQGHVRRRAAAGTAPRTAAEEHVATLALQVTLPQPQRPQRGSLELLRHVAMEVTVEIGRTRMTVGELLSLHPGEVVELDRAASAPADLLVNGTLIARGEVVVVDEDFGLRISEIVSDAAAELGGMAP